MTRIERIQPSLHKKDRVLVYLTGPLGIIGAALALLISAGLDSIGFAMAGAGVLAMAMGAENSVFQRDGEVTIGLTYMTGTLVKMGQRIAGALLGGPKLAFLRHLASLRPHLVIDTGDNIASAASIPVLAQAIELDAHEKSGPKAAS